MLSALLIEIAILWQINQPPDFEAPGAFRTGGGTQAIDGTSHVAGQRQQVSRNLVRALADFDLTTLTEAERRSFEEGRRLIEGGLLAAGGEAFASAVSAYPKSDALALGHGVAQFLLGQSSDSARIVMAVAERRPGATEWPRLVGEMSSAWSGWQDRVERALRAAAAERPESAEVRYYLGMSSVAANAPEQARREFEEAARLDAADARPCLEIAKIAAGHGGDDAAVAWLDRAVARDPSLAEAHYRLARIHTRAGRRELSERHWKRFRELSQKR